jgi:hypothetical protein
MCGLPSEPTDNVIEKEKRCYQSENDVAHQLPISLARIYHLRQSVDGTTEQTSRAVKICVLCQTLTHLTLTVNDYFARAEPYKKSA